MESLARVSNIIVREIGNLFDAVWTNAVMPVGRFIKTIAKEVWKIESEIVEARFNDALSLMIAEEPIKNNIIYSSWYHSLFRELLGLPATIIGGLAGGVFYPLILMSTKRAQSAFAIAANLSLFDVPVKEQWKSTPVALKGNYAQQALRILFSIPGSVIAFGAGLVVTGGTLALRTFSNSVIHGPYQGLLWGLKKWFSKIEINPKQRAFFVALGDFMEPSALIAKYEREYTTFEKILGIGGVIAGALVGLVGGAGYHGLSGIWQGMVRGTTLPWHQDDRPKSDDIFKGEGWLSSSIHFFGFVIGGLSLGIIGLSLSIIARFALNNFYGIWDGLQWASTQFKLGSQDKFTSFKQQPGTKRARSWFEVSMGFVGIFVGAIIGLVYVAGIKLRDSLKELFKSMHAGFIYAIKTLWGIQSNDKKYHHVFSISSTLGASFGGILSLIALPFYMLFESCRSIAWGVDEVLARTWILNATTYIEPVQHGLIPKMQSYVNIPFKVTGKLLGVLIAGISVFGCGLWNGFTQSNNLILHKNEQLSELSTNTLHVNPATLITLSLGYFAGNTLGLVTGIVFVGLYRTIGNSFDSFTRDSSGYINFLLEHATFDAWKGDAKYRDNVSRYFGIPGRILAASSIGLGCFVLKSVQYVGALSMAFLISPLVAAWKAKTMYTMPRFKPADDNDPVINRIKDLNAALNDAGNFDDTPIHTDTQGNKGSISFIRKMFTANNYTVEEKVLDAVLDAYRKNREIEIDSVVESVYKDERSQFMRQSEVDLKRSQIKNLTISIVMYVSGSANTLNLNSFWVSNKQKVNLFNPDEPNLEYDNPLSDGYPSTRT